jgi:hypothetical protein
MYQRGFMAGVPRDTVNLAMSWPDAIDWRQLIVLLARGIWQNYVPELDES